MMSAAQETLRYPPIEEHGLIGDLQNFPQVFTNLALVDAALTLDRALDGGSSS